MRKIIMTLSALCALFVCSCSSTGDEPIIPEKKQEVSFLLDYTFESGSMSRSNAEVYDDFYENNIKTKTSIADSYQITFTDKKSGVAHSFSGKWSDEEKIKLPVGEYSVKGASVLDAMCHSKASIGFEKDIEIKADTKQVVLDAHYKCFLVMFVQSNIKIVEFVYGSNYVYLSEYNGYSYGFCKNLYGEPYFVIEKDNGSEYELKINISDYENGKYYIFSDNDEPSTFNLPKMSAGN